MQPVPAAAATGQHRRADWLAGETLDVDEFLAWLVAHGFHNTPAVELPGEFSPRGGLLDIFAPDWYDPIRIELFGDQIESIRRFEVSSQRSLELLAVDVTILDPAEDRSHLGDYLPPASWFLLVEPGELEEEGRHYLNRLERPKTFIRSAKPARGLQVPLGHGGQPVDQLAGNHLPAEDRIGRTLQRRYYQGAPGARFHDEGQDVYIVCQTEAECQRLHEIFSQTRMAAESKLHFIVGRLRTGFRLVPNGSYCSAATNCSTGPRSTGHRGDAWAASSTAFWSCAKATW